ncbi:MULTISPECIES: hypothetical protein [Campylobacter]|uniref:hypothetical protein n=1 Tax=Campylobacter TaxID=194 RepID=UPI0023F0CB73|nr:MULTISPECIES: hypothetical protein [Campylobacter]MCI6641651.1 hypothetical protein [Campylobacter sp.]MDD7422567.1 hypothetical protein [Campylobacter hominis]MDY3117757.1 hypothetical protein [Campylobacter hominis]
MNLSNEILTFIDGKMNDIEFIVFLIISIFSLVIKKFITDSIAQSEKIFINTQKENLKKLNKIYFALVQLSLKPNSKFRSKKLYKLLLNNFYTMNTKEDTKLLESIYDNCEKNKDLNEKMILEYTRKIQIKIKEINNIIDKNNSTYSEFQSNPIMFYIKKILLVICIVFSMLVFLYVLQCLFTNFKICWKIILTVFSIPIVFYILNFCKNCKFYKKIKNSIEKFIFK